MNIAGTKPTAAIPARLDCGDLTVVGGAGHVGIPLVLAFAEAGYRVNVHDVNRDALATLQSGRMPFIEHGGEQLLVRALKRSRLVFTSSPADVFRTGPVIITIGTPIDEFLNPVRKVVQDCIDALLPYLADGQLLVLRSTVFPGTTDWLDGYLRRRNRHLKVAFCPERMVQGQGIKELKETPQIISGTTAAAEEEAAKLFSAIAPELIVVKPREAEFAKLFSNAYRYNPRARGIPSPGLAAGPCLMKDTMQLAAFAQNQFSLGNAAMLVNEGLVLHVCDDLRRRYDLSRMTVGLLGMAFKADIDDTRASLSYKFKKALASLAEAVLTTDPFVTTDPDLVDLDEVTRRSDLLILCAPHSAYRDLDFAGKPVLDVWGFLTKANVIA